MNNTFCKTLAYKRLQISINGFSITELLQEKQMILSKKWKKKKAIQQVFGVQKN